MSDSVLFVPVWGGCLKLVKKLSDDLVNTLGFVTPTVYAESMNIKVIPTAALVPGMHLAGSSSRVLDVIKYPEGDILITFVHAWAPALAWKGDTIAIVDES